MPKPSGSLFPLLFLPVYFLLTVAIGLLARRHGRTASDYLNASRSLPLWIVTAAYLAANCGALDIVGMSAMAAQYGVPALHFYWIGAIPAMIFLALWMMPVYRSSGVRSVPQYLALRFGPSLQLVNSCLLAVTVLLLSGVSLFAIGQVLEVVSGWAFGPSILVSAVVVLVYVLLGGVRATIYNEVFQLIVILAGIVPLAFLTVHAGVPHGSVPAAHPPPAQATHTHLWLGVPFFSHTAPLDAAGIMLGLGFVLSFGYWCTDFVQMQRAFTARTDREARQVPLWAAFGKLGFGLAVVIPGLAAARLFPELGSERRFDQAIPRLMTLRYGPVMLALGVTAMVASLMSGLAANVSAFAALWTEEIYRGRLVRSAAESHYLRVGRWTVAFAICISLLTSYINFLFSNLMEHVQLIFSVFGAPFWAIFLLGMATRRTSERGAIAGLLSGVAIALLHVFAVAQQWVRYGSAMNANFHVAIYAFAASVAVAYVVSPLPGTSCVKRSSPLLFHWDAGLRTEGTGLLWILSALLLAACLLLNYAWR